MHATPTFSARESEHRVKAFQERMAAMCPETNGTLVFSRLNIFYFTGSWINGALWIPAQGAPVLLCRKGMDRARLESPLKNTASFVSFKELPGLVADFGDRLQGDIGAEMSGLPWSLANLLQSRLNEIRFTSADAALARTRAVKTEFELELMREAGRRHHQAKYRDLPARIRPGLSEYEIAVCLWDVFFALGHQGMMRMQAPGEEIFLGHVSAGDSGIHPSVFNGPVGLRGVHPAVPFMGAKDRIWTNDEPLTVDCGFGWEGYHTDKTQVYWSQKAVIPDEARKAQDVCLGLQNDLARELKPGAVPEELFAKYWDQAVKSGFKEGFMGIGSNKVRFLGHGIGLHIDEYPVIARGFTEPLEKNMVLALEPKIGIPGLGMVGVENTFLVTENGGLCLTGDEFDPVLV